MELFSEIYSCYFNITHKLLERGIVSKNDIDAEIRKKGFSETSLHLLPRLTGEDGWRLLQQQGELFYSCLKNKPETPLSSLELCWLKSIMQDKRFQLFFTDAELEHMDGYLKDCPPLFSLDSFYAFDQYTDGDSYDDDGYRQRFLILLRAMKNQIPVKITYRNKEMFSRQCHCMPLKLEYSEKDDKFRVYCGKISKGRMSKYCTLNLGRITYVQLSGLNSTHLFQMQEYFDQVKSKEPVVIEITDERQAIERVMLELSSYEKRSEYDEKTGICTTQVYYNKNDESELLIRLLGFGPVLRVVSPPHFVKLMKERMKVQSELLESMVGL